VNGAGRRLRHGSCGLVKARKRSVSLCLLRRHLQSQYTAKRDASPTVITIVSLAELQGGSNVLRVKSMRFIDFVRIGASAFLLFPFAFVFALPAGGTIVKSLDLPDLVQQSGAIAHVAVTNLDSFWSGSGGAAGGSPISTPGTSWVVQPTAPGNSSTP
jgi:hypothetical protein